MNGSNQVSGKEACTTNSYIAKFIVKVVTYATVYLLENSAHLIDISGNVTYISWVWVLTLQVINVLYQKMVWLHKTRLLILCMDMATVDSSCTCGDHS